MKTWLFFLTLAACHALAFADSPARQPAVLDQQYTGHNQEAYTAYFDRVRLLVHQAQLEASSRLGLFQYREGFRFPLTVRFQDGAPSGLENTLAYVRFSGSDVGFRQELVVNLDELAKNPTDFDAVFYHEMTHAVLNDAVGGKTGRIPRWTHEGLAMYVSREGDERVKTAGGSVYRSQVGLLVVPLDAPPSGRSYPQYYLAIKYLDDKHSVNAVQALVRSLIEGKTIIEAIQEATNLTPEQFTQNVKIYSRAAFENYAIPDGVIRK